MYDELVLAYYSMVKAVASTIVAILQDRDYKLGADRLWVLRVQLKHWQRLTQQVEERSAYAV